MPCGPKTRPLLKKRSNNDSKLLILALETATKACSVALGRGEEILASRDLVADAYLHSEKLHLFIEAVLEDARLSALQCDAFALGAGPGSYTGLRIGTAAAKGLAFAANKPLLTVSSLTVLARAAQRARPEEKLRPTLCLMDARRDEYYAALYSAEGKRLWGAKALQNEALLPLLQDQGPCNLVGDGVAKFRQLNPEREDVDLGISYPSARDLIPLALQAHRRGETADLAYFEPHYLKEFQAIKAKSRY